jgi:hypothetical protein
MDTYTISKDQWGGAYVQGRILHTSYAADGSYRSGEPVRLSHQEQVAEAVQRVIATGEAETLTIGEPAAPVAEPQREPCPHYTSDQGCPLHGETCR